MAMNKRDTENFNSAGLKLSTGVQSKLDLNDILRAYVRNFGGN